MDNIQIEKSQKEMAGKPGQVATHSYNSVQAGWEKQHKNRAAEDHGR